MNKRQQKKTLRSFERWYQLDEGYLFSTKRRRAAFVRDLCKQLDAAYDRAARGFTIGVFKRAY